MIFKFPPGFLWGSSISSYQTEGLNNASDWFVWEKKQNLEPAGKSTNHYNLFQSDISLLHSLGQNALRFSIEWSRIYHSKSSVSRYELDHYRDVLYSLREKGIVPVVTLHHFTNPLWFIERGGWLRPGSVDEFISYVRTIVSYLKDLVQYWIVFNEPMVYIYNGFIEGVWPPGVKSAKKGLKALDNIVKAYLLAYVEIKRIYGRDQSYISIAKHMRIFSSCTFHNSIQNNIFAYLRSHFFNFKLINYISNKQCLDFIGVNYYCREFVRAGKTIFGVECRGNHHRGLRNSLGWFVYPDGLYLLLMKLKKYNIPVIITENGTSESTDEAYYRFMYSHIESVAKAIVSGIDVKGYFWWSLLDNFEWDKGYKHKFGLVEVNFKTFERNPRKFALEYKKICTNNAIEVHSL